MRKKKIPAFWKGVGIYTAILLVLSGLFLLYTDSCLVQYEYAQPESAMGRYVTEFEKMVADGTVYDSIDMPVVESAFEADDAYKVLYQASLEGINAYTFEKDAGSYMTEMPKYIIYGDGKPVASVELSASNERTIFGILTIMDWETLKVTPVIEVEPRDYIVRIPDVYSATVNGIDLSAGGLTGEVSPNPDFVNVLDYVEMPSILEYSLKGLIRKPEIQVFNEQGKEMAVVPDEDGNVIMTNLEPSEMPKDRYDDALKMAKAWDNFLTKDLDGGLTELKKYLIKDSYYWKKASEYARSIDITFISMHSLANPPYSNIEISDYVSYGENCYSCHIYFEKNMLLTKTGEIQVNTMNSTFYFVKYDDSDDNIDNPHWAIADMVATTKKRDT